MARSKSGFVSRKLFGSIVLDLVLIILSMYLIDIIQGTSLLTLILPVSIIYFIIYIGTSKYIKLNVNPDNALVPFTKGFFAITIAILVTGFAVNNIPFLGDFVGNIWDIFLLYGIIRVGAAAIAKF